MNPNDLYIFFTMDCEAVCDRDMSQFNMGAPPDWQFSGRSIRRFDEVLGDEGLVGTYFIVPDNARVHRDMWQELAERGNELGLHLHPQGFGDGRWDRFFGEYDARTQLQLLREAGDAWSDALGRRPRVFRPGNFSGDPSVVPTLIEAGFVAGSVSLPERVRPELAAAWRGVPHSCALVPADAPRPDAFLEVPVSSWTEAAAGDRHDPPHLRVEARSMDEGAFRTVIAQNLDSPLPVPPLPRTLVVMTHNTPDYTEAAMEQRLRRLIDQIRDGAANRGLRVVNSSIEGLRRDIAARG